MRTARHGYIFESFIAAGGVGYHHSGSKVHLVHAQRVVGYEDGFTPKPGTMKLGNIWSCYASCNGNGQNVGRVYERLTLEDINCKRCRKIAGMDGE